MNENTLKSYYKNNYEKHGHHESSLGWTKGKQFVRFHALTRNFQMNNASILDIGCGFADFINFAKKNEISYLAYLGIDLMEEFIKISREQHGDDKRNSFEVKNFKDLNQFECDYVIASGIFGHKLAHGDEENYRYIEETLRQSLSISKKGVAFDFISDKVDFRTSENDFHASPSRILDIAYKFSKNVTLDNSVMPFEFVLIVHKDQSFKKEKTVFETFMNTHEDMFLKGKL